MAEHDALIREYSHLQHLSREKEALHTLKKIASLVKPIMRARNWKVGVLAEFSPDQQNLLGINVNRGQKICLRLRYPGDQTQFLPLEQVVDTMLHELCHNVIGPHNAEFGALWDQLRKEHASLIDKGYTGEGFLSDGRVLGGRRVPRDEARRIARAAAEKRRAFYSGSGQRLGGAPIRAGTDMRKVIVDAIERRNTVLKGCGSGDKDDSEIKDLADQATRNGFKTQAEEDEANERAISQAMWELVQEDQKKEYGSSYIASTPANPTGNGGGEFGAKPEGSKAREPPSPTFPSPSKSRSLPARESPRHISRLVAESASKKSKPIAKPIRKAIPDPPAPDPPSPIISDGWTCPVCTLHNPLNFLTCDACTSVRPEEITREIADGELAQRNMWRFYNLQAATMAFTVALPYKIWFLWFEPISAAISPILIMRNPVDFLTNTSPIGLTPYIVPSDSSTKSVNPLTFFLSTNIAALYLFFGLSEFIVLRATKELSVWKALFFAMIFSDAGHLYSTSGFFSIAAAANIQQKQSVTQNSGPGFLTGKKERKMHSKVVVIGSGPAAHTAAIYLSRAELKPVLYEGFLANGIAAGGQLTTTTEVENYPGFPKGIGGQALMDDMRAQSERFGTEIITETIAKVDLSSRPFKYWPEYAEDKAPHTADAIIIATGASARRLGLPGEDKYWQNGISACAVCDGAVPIFRNKPLVVIGGGDSAAEEAIFLTKYGSHVTVLVRKDKLRASKMMAKRLLANKKVTVRYNSVAGEVTGDDRGLMSHIVVKDLGTGKEEKMEANGLFYAVGHDPATALFKGQIDTDTEGYVVTKPGTSYTNVNGVFAAGDVQDKRYRQAITSAGSGCIAALEAEKFLAEQEDSLENDLEAEKGAEKGNNVVVPEYRSNPLL